MRFVYEYFEFSFVLLGGFVSLLIGIYYIVALGNSIEALYIFYTPIYILLRIPDAGSLVLRHEQSSNMMGGKQWFYDIRWLLLCFLGEEK